MSLLERILLVAPVLLFSVIAHEIAHGYAALKQGDPTAKQLGRLTWNPIKHIDPWMTILLPAVLLIASHGRMAIGGARPVPVDPRNYRNYKRGDIIVSLAGVATNLVIAVGCAALIALVGVLGRTSAPSTPLAVLQAMLVYGVAVNMGLIAFNLIPIPPLDGSHVVKYLLPPAWSIRYQRLGFYGIIVLLVLINTRFFNLWMTPAFLLADWLLREVQQLGLLLPGIGRWLQ